MKNSESFWSRFRKNLEPFWNNIKESLIKIKRKLKKSYRKYKYMDRTKARFFVVTTVISFFCLFVGGTYSYFNISEYLDSSIITIARLKYQLTSTNTNFKNNSITVGAGETLELTLDLKSLNPEHTKYALNYSSDSSDIKVYYDEIREQNVLGEIGGLNSIINIKVVIKNNSSSNQTVNFELKGGYLQNILSSNIEEKYVTNVMMARSSYDYSGEFWSQASNIKTVTFETEMSPKENATYTYDVSEDKKGGVMSYLVPNSEDSTKYDLYIQANGNIILSSCYCLFYKFNNLQSINGLGNVDTSQVTNMSYMFSDCSSLTTLDVSNFDTSKVTNMSYMFFDCSSLTTLDVSNFNTSNVTDMSAMFSSCEFTTLNLNNFDTNKVINMSFMFFSCNGLTTLNLNNFNTSNVINMENMFDKCRSLITLNLSNFDTSKVITMKYMFNNCNKLTTLDLSKFNTNNVTDMGYMFYDCSSLTILDLSNFNTSKVTNMDHMFSYCSSLTSSITVRGTKCTNYSAMFINAATSSGAKITVNYTEDASTLVDDMIATKSSNSNVVKASSPEPEYTITLNASSDISVSSTQGYKFKEITLSTNKENYVVTSFKLNGTLVKGNTFKMPGENVTISDVTTVEQVVVESEHNPYPNSLNNQEYLNKTFDGATSLTVVLDYQTESTNYDWIYLYDKDNTQYGKYGGTTRKTETITIPGDTIRIVFKTDGSGNNYYGFKATVTPNY